MCADDCRNRCPRLVETPAAKRAFHDLRNTATATPSNGFSANSIPTSIQRMKPNMLESVGQRDKTKREIVLNNIFNNKSIYHMHNLILSFRFHLELAIDGERREAVFRPNQTIDEISSEQKAVCFKVADDAIRAVPILLGKNRISYSQRPEVSVTDHKTTNYYHYFVCFNRHIISNLPHTAYTRTHDQFNDRINCAAKIFLFYNISCVAMMRARSMCTACAA